MLIEDKYLYTLSDPQFYESLDRCSPKSSDFYDPARRILPDAWSIVRRGIWFHCNPPNIQLPACGWKIHVSATPSNCGPVLATVSRCVTALDTSFKFALDRNMLFLLNGKRWPRGAAGKFITVYPRGESEFLNLLEKLYDCLMGFTGPHILSDRRYKDCGVLHYRYGGILQNRVLDVRGHSAAVLGGRGLEGVADIRTPYFKMPDGVSDPCQSNVGSGSKRSTRSLKNGRYIIQSAISFSNTGGVYVALDTRLDKTVVVKEARPNTNVSTFGTDSVALLKKEHRLLSLLDNERIAPRAFDFFREWEHYFLVQEYLDGRVLRGFMAQSALALITNPSISDVREFYDRYRKLFARLAEMLETLHQRNVIFSDVSHYNVMVLRDGGEPKFIDFEGAYEVGVDPPPFMYTPGFASGRVLKEGAARVEDDWYGFGGLMFAGLMPLNAIIGLDPLACERFLEAWSGDLCLPEGIRRTISRLMGADVSGRPPSMEIIRALTAEHSLSKPEIHTDDVTAPRCKWMRDEIIRYIENALDYHRTDRLFPADPLVFETNPLSIAHGACGVAYTLESVTGNVPEEMTDWILQKELKSASLPPGLYMGQAGVAWVLLELGLREKAADLLNESRNHPLLRAAPDLFYGLAGWGMAQLKFFLEFEDELYLSNAVYAGNRLLEERSEEGSECTWASLGSTSAGLAHGASGISLFLLYLYLLTNDEIFLEVGKKALGWVSARALRTLEGGLSWRAREGEPTYTPYWRWGSAGIGVVLLRYQRLLGNDFCQDILEGILRDTDRKYTIFPGHFFGLAGIGEFLLDCLSFGKNSEEILPSLQRVLSGIMLFAIERKEGVVFPGDTLMRLSCDYGTGSAGVAVFLHRYLTRIEPAFMLDQAFQPRTRRLQKSFSGIDLRKGIVEVKVEGERATEPIA
jgi:serine/threonine protein kinase